MHKNPIRGCIIYIFCAMNFCQAGFLKEELSLRPEKAEKWQSRIKNLEWIETYQLRNYHIELTRVKAIHELINQDNMVHNLSAFAYKEYYKKNLNISLAERTILNSNVQRLDSILTQMPELDTTSYTGIHLTESSWENFKIGSIYMEPGFLHSSGSLHTAHKWLEQPKILLDNMTHPTIIKIEGENAKQMNLFYKTNEAHFVWKTQSRFKIIAKESDTSKNLHFLHLEEVDTPHLPLDQNNNPSDPPPCPIPSS